MDIRRFLLTAKGKLVITNTGDYTNEPTHGDASKAPSLTIENIYGPSSRDSRQDAIHSARQFLEQARCARRHSLSFPEDVTEVLQLAYGQSISTTERYKVWKIELIDEGILLHVIDAIFVPDKCPPSTIGEILIASSYLSFDVKAQAYEQYPAMKYSCFATSDAAYPEMKQRRLQAYREDPDTSNYAKCGFIEFHKNLTQESFLNVSSK